VVGRSTILTVVRERSLKLMQTFEGVLTKVKSFHNASEHANQQRNINFSLTVPDREAGYKIGNPINSW